MDESTNNISKAMQYQAGEYNKIRIAIIDALSRYDDVQRQLGARIKASLDQASLIHRISQTVDSLQDQLKQLPPRMMQAAYSIGNNGWTIPFELPLSLLWEMEKTDKDLDEIFLEYYSVDDCANFRQLVKDILSFQEIGAWREAFEQCVEAYQRQHYLITIPLLICLLEGLLSSLNKDIWRIPKICEAEVQKALSQGNQVDTAAWISVLEFINALWKSSNFTDDEPVFINRHWILHGRTQVNWKKADSLRLFNAIGTLASIF